MTEITAKNSVSGNSQHHTKGTSSYTEAEKPRNAENQTEILPVRALFVSDVHLGSPHAAAEEFLTILNSYKPERLYLVGDILDGRRLSQGWHWPKVYNQILNRVAELVSEGTCLFYTPGNHDEFIREILPSLPALFRSDRVRIAEEFLYESKRNARILVTHGDQFDHHEQAAGLISACVTVFYNWLLHGDRFWAQIQPRRPRRELARWVKSQSKHLREFVEEFEEAAVTYAERGGYDGIICGHVHDPKIVSRRSISYCNLGDWVEHCSMLIEQLDGDWELTYFHPQSNCSANKTTWKSALLSTPFRNSAPAGTDLRLTLLKSNRWTHRHSFLGRPQVQTGPQVPPASEIKSDAASAKSPNC